MDTAEVDTTSGPPRPIPDMAWRPKNAGQNTKLVGKVGEISRAKYPELSSVAHYRRLWPAVVGPKFTA